MIKNINDLKKCQIICRNQKQVKDCLNYLRQLGFDTDCYDSENYLIILYDTSLDGFLTSYELEKKYIEFYNKELVKTLQKFINEKEEKKKKKVEDFEVAEDGRITKINNWDSDKYLYFIARWDYIIIGFTDIDRQDIKYYVNLGLAFISKEARDRAMFKLEIETKLKNIAERLNNGRKIDWENALPHKYFIYYIQSKENQSEEKILLGYDFKFKRQGAIYCLDEKFLEVAKKEIGEENLIKYFKE